MVHCIEHTVQDKTVMVSQSLCSYTMMTQQQGLCFWPATRSGSHK